MELRVVKLERNVFCCISLRRHFYFHYHFHDLSDSILIIDEAHNLINKELDVVGTFDTIKEDNEII